jgi:outer membrane protein assembly factor BamB
VKTTLTLTKLLRWSPLPILLLAAINLARLAFSADLESTFKFFHAFVTIALAMLLLLVWLLAFSGLRWRTRLVTLGTIVLLVFSLTRLLRLDGAANGSGILKLTWKWTPLAEKQTGEIRIATAPASTQACVLAATNSVSCESPGFLGQDRTGVIRNARLDSDWTAHAPLLLWRQPIGVGWSGFAVSRGCAFTQEQRAEKELTVCYDLATGRPLWIHENLTRFKDAQGGDGPRATPTIDDGRVYTLGATGILDCLDAASGKLIWTHDTLVENHLQNLTWGKSCSPLVCDGLVVVTGGDSDGPALLAYHKDTGAVAWQAGKAKASYSSPQLVTLAGRRQILVVNAATVSSHDPVDGHVYWEYTWARETWPKCAQPLVLGENRIFLSAGYGLGCALLQIKAAADGNLAVTELWHSQVLRSKFSNLVTSDRFIYGLDDGVLECIDATTGQRQWKEGRYGHGQVVLAGNLLLVQSEPGPVVLVEAKPSGYRELAKLPALSAKTWNVPTLAGEYLLVRNDREAACYRLPQQPCASLAQPAPTIATASPRQPR